MRSLRVLIIAIAIIFCVPLAANAAAPNVVPSLREWTDGTGTFSMGSGSRICVDSTYSSQLNGTANTFREDIATLNGLNPSVVSTTSPQAGDFYLTLNCSDNGIGDEGYLLEIGNYVTIRAKTAKGVFYGTITALQVLKQSADRVQMQKGTARDYPKYKERGLMLDLGRMYLSMDFLEYYIKNMAWSKMNDLHLHFTENIAFRLQSDNYPGLAPSYESYSHADISRLQSVAAKYNVNITPEIDLPSHSAAITRYNSQLGTATWTGVLNLARTQTFTFVDNILNEFIPLFGGTDFHLGTDETPEGTVGFNGDPETDQYAASIGYTNANDLYRKFINDYNAFVKAKGKKMRVWAWFDRVPGTIPVNNDIVYEAWLASGINDISARGFDIINCSSNYLYIDPGVRLMNNSNIYTNWQPNMFYGPYGDTGTLQPNDPHLIGAKIQVWNDASMIKGIDSLAIQGIVDPSLKTVSECLWGGPKSASYEAFKTRTMPVEYPMGYDCLPEGGSLNDSLTGIGLNRFEYVGNWTASTGSNVYSNDDHYSSTTNSYCQIRFEGNRARIFASKAPNHGITAVSIDGGAERLVDCYSASRLDKTLLYDTGNLTPGRHIIKYRVTGTKNTGSSGYAVNMDRVEIIKGISVNDGTTGTGINQFEFSGTWNTSSGSNVFMGDDHFSNITNAYYQVKTYGTRIKVYGSKANGHGIAAVSIDGGSETQVNCYPDTPDGSRMDQCLLFDSGVLPLGQHTVKVRVTGTKDPRSNAYFINADRVEVYNDSYNGNEWSFNNNGDFEGWGSFNNMSGTTVTGGYLNADITGTDPHLEKSLLDINAVSNKRIEIRLKNNTTSNSLQVFWTTNVDPNFNEAKSVTQVISTNDTSYRTYIIDLSNVNEWRDAVTKLRVDPSSGVTAGAISIDYIKVLPDAQPAEGWYFNNNGQLEGWSSINAMSGVTVSGGSFKANITGTDPFMYSQPVFVDTYKYKHVEIRIKNNTTSNSLKLYWATNMEQSMDEAKSIECNMTSNDSSYKTYTFDLTDAPKWKYYITSLRVDPTSGVSTGSIDIDYIRVLP